MSKKSKPAEAPATADAGTPPKKRSKLKLIILALAPLLLAGGGYVGWTQFFAAKPAHATEAAAAEGEGDHGAADGEDGTDAMEVAALPTEGEAQTSFTHSYALSVLVEQRCRRFDVPALKAASDAEAKSSGLLVNASWVAATRRVEALTEVSCGMLASEILDADARAAAAAEAKAKKDKKGGGHH